MNSYIWRFFKENRNSPAIPALLIWAIVARIEEVAALWNGKRAKDRIVNRPVGHAQFLEFLEKLVDASVSYPPHRKRANKLQLKEILLPPQNAESSDANSTKAITPTPQKTIYDHLVSKGSIEAIATVTGAEWLLCILESNREFTNEFFKQSFADIVMKGDPKRRRQNLITKFWNEVTLEVRKKFKDPQEKRIFRKTLRSANMSGIPESIADTIRPGSEEDLLSRIAYTVRQLQSELSPGMGKAFPAHFSAWSLAHFCLADDGHNNLTSNLFLVGRQSRGTGTNLLGPETRIVRDAIFTYVPRHAQPEDGEVRNNPPIEATYVSSEDWTQYSMSGAAAQPYGTDPLIQTPVWWEYSGRNASGEMKLFFFTQHVEPRAHGPADEDPRIFNAMMLGHLRDPRGDVPGVWIALVKRLKNRRIETRRNKSRQAGFWRNCNLSSDDTADLNFTAECLCFHGRRDELANILRHGGIVGVIVDQSETKDAINIVLNATYGRGEDVTQAPLGYPMQLAANFFAIHKGDERYNTINEVFFRRDVHSGLGSAASAINRLVDDE
jgi:hypothetical protein